jgi:hypothetical protein
MRICRASCTALRRLVNGRCSHGHPLIQMEKAHQFSHRGPFSSFTPPVRRGIHHSKPSRPRLLSLLDPAPPTNLPSTTYRAPRSSAAMILTGRWMLLTGPSRRQSTTVPQQRGPHPHQKSIVKSAVNAESNQFSRCRKGKLRVRMRASLFLNPNRQRPFDITGFLEFLEAGRRAAQLVTRVLHQSVAEVRGQRIETNLEINRALGLGFGFRRGFSLGFLAPNIIPSGAVFRRAHAGEIAVMHLLRTADGIPRGFSVAAARRSSRRRRDRRTAFALRCRRALWAFRLRGLAII